MDKRSLLTVADEHETGVWNRPEQPDEGLSEVPHAVPRIEQANERNDEAVRRERKRRRHRVREPVDLHAVGDNAYPVDRRTRGNEVARSVLTHCDDPVRSAEDRSLGCSRERGELDARPVRSPLRLRPVRLEDERHSPPGGEERSRRGC